MRKDITAIISFGGTRTAYILEKNRHKDNPNEIDYDEYTEYSVQKTQQIIKYYFEAGGHNLIVEQLDIDRLSDSRGEAYTNAIIQSSLRLIDEQFTQFYQANDIDPTFIGFEPLLTMSQSNPIYQLAKKYEAFNKKWQRSESRKKLFWVVAAMPLLAILQQSQTEAGQELGRSIIHNDLQALDKQLYDFFSTEIYRMVIPKPQMYIGSNRSGVVKLSTALPLATGVTNSMPMFLMPYPTFFMKKAHFEKILSSIQRLADKQPDYRWTSPEAVTAYDKIIELSQKVDTLWTTE